MLAASVVLVSFYPEHRPKLTNVSKAVLLFFVVVALSTVTSLDIGKSFIGTIERCFGFWNIVHFGFLYFAAIVTLRSQKEWNVFLSISVAISVYAGLDFLIPLIFGNGSLTTIAGNVTFLAAYLIFHFFFAAFLVTQTKNKWSKGILLIAMAINASVVVSCGVRGAFIGLCAGILYIIVYYAIRSKRIRIPLIILIVIMIASYVALFLNRDNVILKNNRIINRVTNFSLQDTTTRSRLEMWRIAIDGIKERPILGWGMENYSLAFNKYYTPAFNQINVGESWEDRTHNVIFETLINTGFIGLISYILLIAASLSVIYKHPLLTAALVAYVAQSAFGVETLNSYLPFFIFLAFVDFLAASKNAEQITTTRTRFWDNWKILTIINAIFLTSIIATGIYFTVNTAMSNTRGLNMMNSIILDDGKQFVDTYGSSADLIKLFHTMRAEQLGIVGGFVLQKTSSNSQYSRYIPYMSQIIDGLNGYLNFVALPDPRWKFYMAQFIGANAQDTNDMALLDYGFKLMTELVESSPNRKLFLQSYSKYQQTKKFIEDNLKKTPVK
jgi:O-antigen ligase